MSSIRYALERLDSAVSRLDYSVSGAERTLQTQQSKAPANVIDVNFVAGRLDRAIKAVEFLLKEEGGEA